MMLIDFEPGDYVKNPNNLDWGVGQIQSIIGNKVTVNFENFGKRVINIENLTLEKFTMNREDLKKISENLIETFNIAGEESIEIHKKGLKIEIKEDNSPVSNGDLKVNEILTKKIKELTPNIPVISEETVDIKKKIQQKFLVN